MRTVLSAIEWFKKLPDKEPEVFARQKIFSDALPKINQFVLNDDYLHINYEEIISPGEIYYLPFKYCSFEFMTPRPLDEAWVKKLGRPNPVHVGYIFIENDDLSIDLLFVAGSKEESKWPSLNGVPKWISSIDKRYSSYEALSKEEDIRVLLGLVNCKKSVFSRSVDSIEFRRKGRHPDFVKRLVFVSRTKSVREKKEIMGHKIEYFHSWDVMGHWRRISPKMLGKNREGEFSVIGQTWVKAHVKGDGPYIKKDRIVVDGLNHATMS